MRNYRFIKIDELCSPMLDVYTLLKDGDEFTEYEKFDSKIPELEKTHYLEIKAINTIIEEMRDRGPNNRYFKPAKWPPYLNVKKYISYKSPNKNDQGVRLYSILLSDHSIVLLNGDIKLTDKAQHCPNVSEHFKLCKDLDKKITNLLDKNELDLKGDLHNFEINL